MVKPFSPIVLTYWIYVRQVFLFFLTITATGGFDIAAPKVTTTRIKKIRIGDTDFLITRPSLGMTSGRNIKNLLVCLIG
jgi:hypothetical protein